MELEKGQGGGGAIITSEVEKEGLGDRKTAGQAERSAVGVQGGLDSTQTHHMSSELAQHMLTRRLAASLKHWSRAKQTPASRARQHIQNSSRQLSADRLGPANTNRATSTYEALMQHLAGIAGGACSSGRP